MKLYDYSKAKKLITQKRDEITDATLGMHEDWFWTAEAVFEDGEFVGEFAKDVKDTDIRIGGIKGSTWATPCIMLTYKDGREEMIECYTGESDDSNPPPLAMIRGPLSGPTQDSIPPISNKE